MYFHIISENHFSSWSGKISLKKLLYQKDILDIYVMDLVE